MTDRTHPDSGRIITSSDVIADLQDRIAELEAEQQAASSAVLKAIREANMQLVRTGDDAFMLVPYKLATAEQQAAPKAAPGEPDGFGSAEHWKEKAQYWAGVAHRLRGEALRGEPVDGIVHPPAPQQEAQEPCPTCAALARTVMMDQVSFDRKPDCYGIRQVTDDESVEEWEDIRTSPDVAREEANDMMATGRGEIYEVVPLYTSPQPAPADLEQLRERTARMGLDVDRAMRGHVNEQSPLGTQRLAAIAALVKPKPAPPSDDVVKDAARWRMAALIGNEVMLHPDKRTHATAVKAYMDATHSGTDLTGAVDAAIAAQGGKDAG